MDGKYLASALRYVSLNPVRARLVKRARDWRWSSTRAHLPGQRDGLTALAPIRARFPRFAELLDDELETDLFARLRAAESIGRPLGDDRFLTRIERRRSAALKHDKRGPKPAGPKRRRSGARRGGRWGDKLSCHRNIPVTNTRDQSVLDRVDIVIFDMARVVGFQLG